MCTTQPFSKPRSLARRAVSTGFTLVEMMVGLLIGLMVTIAIAQVLFFAEGQKRSTTAGMDAQVNGALALATLQRDIQGAGYGLTVNPPTLGCQIQAYYNDQPVSGFPTVLAPALIQTNSTDPDLPDTLRILSSAKSSYAVLSKLTGAIFSGGDTFQVETLRGLSAGVANSTPADLMMATDNNLCQVFQISQLTQINSQQYIKRFNDGQWNKAGFPSITTPAFLMNLGGLIDHTYSISAPSTTPTLTLSSFTLSPNSVPSYTSNELFANVVQLRAYYGKDTNADGTIDLWDKTSPGNSAGWQQVLAVRVALVTRSVQTWLQRLT
jgi:type IV pilus assembly protein PilW